MGHHQLNLAFTTFGSQMFNTKVFAAYDRWTQVHVGLK